MSEIARQSELAFSYMFRLLPEMERDGLVVSEKKGKEKIYQLTDYGRDLYAVLSRRRPLEALKPQIEVGPIPVSITSRSRPLFVRKARVRKKRKRT